MRFLVVDDNFIARAMLRAMLEAKGHQVVAEAEDLTGTLKAYETDKPDIVTLDLSLAKEDGITILKALRQKHKQAKVLIISGNDQKKIKDTIFAEGALGFIVKPVQMDELTEAVSRCL